MISTSTMSRGAIYEVSCLIVICILSLFFFPAPEGPYPAVHGPVTALQAARSSARLHGAIAAAVVNVFPTLSSDCTDSFLSPAPGEPNIVATSGDRTIKILRC